MKLVVVESPAKAKTINNYLGKDFEVLASYGHIRDLPSKNGSVDPDNHFAMTWEMDARAKKQVQEIAKAAKKADTIYLATDPDREGEAISWHVLQVLQEQHLTANKIVKRVVFNEITKSAVQYAVAHPRDLDDKLIQAYLARRALDYLVGFNLSPVLWRKLPGSRSAGRVQSVALRLITDREAEIERFIPQEYWSVTGLFGDQNTPPFTARLVKAQGDKIDKMTLKTQAQTEAIVASLKTQDYHVTSIETKPVKRNPAAPFITSTLQQEAARKLRFSAKKTMQVAQKLYEGIAFKGETVGLITYMRTDSTNLAGEAIAMARRTIESRYGEAYLPKSPRQYTKKAKNAQEAHEAIRPTDAARAPEDLKSILDSDQLKLYELIWKRFLACQMMEAKFDQTTILIASKDDQHHFKTTGSVLVFDGFLKVYEEGRDEDPNESEGDGDQEQRLPTLKENQDLDLLKVDPEQHFTQAPPRYSEASLVKKLEELGIGRPSTYASILSTLLDRSYAKKERSKLIPEALGRVVTDFLVAYFPRYVEYDFTAELEEELDDIASGEANWEDALKSFWKDFHQAVDGASTLKISDVISHLNKSLEHFLFPNPKDPEHPRKCPSCEDGELSLKLGKFGAFIGCSNYPDCKHTTKLSGTAESDDDKENATPENAQKAATFETQVLGSDPQSNQEVTLRKGPYGFYFQWGEGEGKKKPKRVSLPSGKTLEEATLELALKLGAFPKTLGTHPETGEDITAGLGRFGPYVKYQNKFTSIPKDFDPHDVTLADALEIIAQAANKKATTKKTTGTKKSTAKEASAEKDSVEKENTKKTTKAKTASRTKTATTKKPPLKK